MVAGGLGRSGDATVHRQSQLRTAKRESERASRQRRRDNLERMRETVQLLEQLVVALPLVGGRDAAGWDEFLDDDVKRVRGLLRRLVPANETVKALMTERAQLRALLAERRLASEALRALADAQRREDDWDLEVQRWKALARIHFRPWTEEQCMAEQDNALQETYRFASGDTNYSTGLNFMGWQDSLRLLQGTGALQFSIHKTFRGRNLTCHIEFVKSLHRDVRLYEQVVLGGRARAAVDVLQVLAPKSAIVMHHERHHGENHTVHSISLISELKTEGSTIQLLRSIEAPQVARALQSKTDVRVRKHYWMHHEMLDQSQSRHACDYRSSLRGTATGQDPIYLRLWVKCFCRSCERRAGCPGPPC